MFDYEGDHWRCAIIQCAACGSYAPREIRVRREGGVDVEIDRFYCPDCGTADPIIAFCKPLRIPSPEEIARANAAAAQRARDAEEATRNRLRGRSR